MIKYNDIVSDEYTAKEENNIKIADIYNLAYNTKIDKTKDKNEALIIIDPQRDFIDTEKGSLAVNGAIEDIKRVNKFIFENIETLTDIYVTLDTHYYDSIFHSYLWKYKNGEYVKPFEVITTEKIESGKVIPLYKAIQADYVKRLKEYGNRDLIIWPYHCIYASDGWIIEKQLNNMLTFFEVARGKNIKKIMKGTDKFTEMYGALFPEVIDKDKNYDISWVYELEKYDKLYICGEAKDFCLYETVKQFCEFYKSKKDVTKRLNVIMNFASAIGDNEVCNNKYEELRQKYSINLINI